MKILVFGSTGFIGKNLVSKLKKTGHEIYTSSKSTGVDMTDYPAVAQLIRDTNPDIVYNVAANVGSLHYVNTYAADVITENVEMSINLYKALKNECPTAKVINSLANCSYPATSSIQREGEWLCGAVHDSVFSFGNVKRIIYYLSRCYYKQYGIKTVNLIFPNTYGPGDSCDPNKTHALNGMIIRMLKAQKAKDDEFAVWGTGSPIREWLYVDDFSKIMILALDIEHMDYPTNVGQERGYSISETADMIKRSSGFQGDIVYDNSYPDGDKIKVMAKDRFEKLFPLFEFHDHEKGISSTVSYYRGVL